KVRVLQSHAVYAAMVESMDRAVGKVLDRLEALGLDDSTAVFFIGDNGGLSTSEGSPTSNLPLRGGKGWIYEGGIREAFLARCPGVSKPGTVSSEPVCSTDFYPTILDFCNIPLKPTQHLDGKSLLPLMQGHEHLDRDYLFWHYPHYSNQGGFPAGAVRHHDWKLVERLEDGRTHLYNLKQDAGERIDLASQNPERVEQMREKLHRWYQEVGAKFLQPKEGRVPWRPY
ncbi:MAG: sulfatase-like hydrolase/transferase, partial [Rubripirellula sp.]